MFISGGQILSSGPMRQYGMNHGAPCLCDLLHIR